MGGVVEVPGRGFTLLGNVGLNISSLADAGTRARFRSGLFLPWGREVVIVLLFEQPTFANLRGRCA